MKRFDYIDIAKGIGILMVVWAHIMVTGWTHRLIYSFHMPLFFFLSGMLFRREKYQSFGTFIARRAKRLLLPYVIYSVATWGIWAAFRYLRHDEVDSYFMPLLQTFIAQGSGEFMVHNSALWFIPCLFLVEILYFFISYASKLWCIVACFALATLSFVLGHTFGADYWFIPPWNADAALIALPFYCIGNIVIGAIGHNKMVGHVLCHKLLYAIGWIGMTALLYWSAMVFGECSMGSSSYQCNGMIFISRAFLGIACLVLFSIFLDFVQNHDRVTSIFVKYMKWAGVNSLGIMCLHIPVKGICMILVAIAMTTSVEIVGSNFAYALIAFVATMIVVWLTIIAIERFVRCSHCVAHTDNKRSTNLTN